MRILFTLTMLFLCACGQKERTFKELPLGPIKHELIVLAKRFDKVVAKGFSLATPADTEVSLSVGAVTHDVRSRADGSFLLELKHTDPTIDRGHFRFRVGDKVFVQTYTIKIVDSTQADKSHPSNLKDIAKPYFATDGREISAFDFRKQQVAVLSSEASLVRFFNVSNRFVLNDKPASAILLNQKDTNALGARTIMTVGNFFVTPLFDTHAVALINAETQRIDALERLRDRSGKLLRFTVDPPLHVSDPIDADDSLQKSTIIAKTTARNAEAVIALDDRHFLLSFANYYQPADFSHNSGAVVGPGIVALMDIEGDKVKTKSQLVMPFKNPSFFVKKNEQTIWVACVGAWQATQSGVFKSTDVGLVRLVINGDFSSIRIEHQIPLNDFAIAEPALVGSKLILPHSWQNEIAVIDENAHQVRDIDKKIADTRRDFRFTFATAWHDDIVFLGDAHGTLVAYSLKEGFFPFPFLEPIVLDENIDQKVMLNPIKLRFRHENLTTALAENHPAGYSAWVLTATYRIYPLDFLSIFGP